MKDIFEFATIKAIASLPEPDNQTIKEATATIFVETHNAEQIEEMIKNLHVFTLMESITQPGNESLKWVNSFIDSIRQKAFGKNEK